MPMDETEIVRRITDRFPDATVEMTDLAGDGDHWAAKVTSAAFNDLNRVQQHKAVYAALGTDMGTTLHALQLQTFAKD